MFNHRKYTEDHFAKHENKCEGRREKIMAAIRRCGQPIMEWLAYSLLFFFLYGIIWILADLPDFKLSISEQYRELLADFVLCGIFSLSSGYMNRWLFRQQRFKRESQDHHTFVVNGLMVLGFNLLIAGGCELMLFLSRPPSLWRVYGAPRSCSDSLPAWSPSSIFRSISPTRSSERERKTSPSKSDT